MPVTLREVASKANVSIKTVSRVINREANVAEETRQKVLAVIEELGYVPNVWAQRLRRHQSRIVTLLFSDASSLYLMRSINGLIDAGNHYHYTINLHSMDPKDKKHIDYVLAIADQKLVDGFVITPPCDESERLLDKLHEMEFPFIQLSPRKPTAKYPWVAATDEQGSFEATRYLISLGHRRIGYIQGKLDHQASWDRLRGYKSALQEAGIEFDETIIRQGDWTFDSGLREGRSLLTLPQPPSAIMGNDETAAAVIQVAWELGIQCPEQLSVVGFDDIPLARQITPSLTTVRQHVSEIAQNALSVLIEQLIPGTSQEISIQIPTTLIIRESTRKYNLK